MADVEKTNAAPDQEFNDDGSKNPDYVKPKDESEGGGAAPDKKDGEDTGTDTDTEDAFDDDATPEVPVRGNAASQIIARKTRTIKKLKKEKDEDGDGGDDTTGDDDDSTPDTPVDVQEEVSKQLKPVVESMTAQADKGELAALFAAEPDAKKYKKHIEAYMGHDMYKGVPAAVIFHHLAFQQAQALGAKKKTAADLEAGQNKSGGRDIRKEAPAGVDGLPTAEAIENMSEEDFETLQNSALQGNFVNKK